MTALPSVIPLTPILPEFDLARTQPAHFQRAWIVAGDDDELQIVCNGSPLRVHAVRDLDGKAMCAVLPLDALFDVRLKAARRLWLAAYGRDAGPDPAALSKTRRDRMVRGLRALDGRLDGATYREIATVLYGAHRLPERGWKTHDLRGRTVKLCDMAFDYMNGGYRQLLLHPFRQRLY